MNENENENTFAGLRSRIIPLDIDALRTLTGGQEVLFLNDYPNSWVRDENHHEAGRTGFVSSTAPSPHVSGGAAFITCFDQRGESITTRANGRTWAGHQVALINPPVQQGDTIALVSVAPGSRAVSWTPYTVSVAHRDRSINTSATLGDSNDTTGPSVIPVRGTPDRYVVLDRMATLTLPPAPEPTTPASEPQVGDLVRITEYDGDSRNRSVGWTGRITAVRPGQFQPWSIDVSQHDPRFGRGSDGIMRQATGVEVIERATPAVQTPAVEVPAEAPAPVVEQALRPRDIHENLYVTITGDDHRPERGWVGRTARVGSRGYSYATGMVSLVPVGWRRPDGGRGLPFWWPLQSIARQGTAQPVAPAAAPPVAQTGRRWVRVLDNWGDPRRGTVVEVRPDEAPSHTYGHWNDITQQVNANTSRTVPTYRTVEGGHRVVGVLVNEDGTPLTPDPTPQPAPAVTPVTPQFQEGDRVVRTGPHHNTVPPGREFTTECAVGWTGEILSINRTAQTARVRWDAQQTVAVPGTRGLAGGNVSQIVLSSLSHPAPPTEQVVAITRAYNVMRGDYIADHPLVGLNIPVRFVLNRQDTGTWGVRLPPGETLFTFNRYDLVVWLAERGIYWNSRTHGADMVGIGTEQEGVATQPPAGWVEPTIPLQRLRDLARNAKRSHGREESIDRIMAQVTRGFTGWEEAQLVDGRAWYKVENLAGEAVAMFTSQEQAQEFVQSQPERTGEVPITAAIRAVAAEGQRRSWCSEMNQVLDKFVPEMRREPVQHRGFTESTITAQATSTGAVRSAEVTVMGGGHNRVVRVDVSPTDGRLTVTVNGTSFYMAEPDGAVVAPEPEPF